VEFDNEQPLTVTMTNKQAR